MTFMAATIAMIKNIDQIGIVYMFKESEFFLHNICGKELQRWVQHSPLDRPVGLVVMIESHDIFKIMDFILFPLQIIVFFTDYSSRFQIIVFP